METTHVEGGKGKVISLACFTATPSPINSRGASDTYVNVNYACVYDLLSNMPIMNSSGFA